MFNKKNLLFLLLLFHLTISADSDITSTNYCKGRESIKCHGIFRYECGESNTHICSKSKNNCNKYNLYVTKLITVPSTDPLFAIKELKQINDFYLFKRQILDCQNIKMYVFKSNEICFNQKYCKLIREYDCNCPLKISFKCGKYCTIDSISCVFYKSSGNFLSKNNINDCGNYYHNNNNNF